MTFSEWMGQNGYSEYNSASGRRKLQQQYGITGDSYSANMALWKKLREEKSKGNGSEQPAATTKEQAAPAKMEQAAPLQSKVATLQVSQQAPEKILPDNYTYYGQYLPEVKVTGSKQDMTEQELKQWIADNINDPHTFFSPQYYRTIERIPESWWKKIYNYKDANGNKPYAAYRQTKREEFDTEKKAWEQREADPEKREKRRRKDLEIKKLLNDPERFFSPEYKKQRDELSVDTWVKILRLHPEYVRHEKYRRYLPTENTPEGREIWSKVANADIAKAMDKAGNAIAPVIFGAGNPLAMTAAMVGGLATDEIVREASQNKYANWNDMFQDKVYGDGNDASSAAGEAFRNIAGTVTNPGALIAGAGVSAATNGVYARPVKLEANGNLASGAGQGVTNIPYNIYPRYQFRTTTQSHVPTTRGAGVGRGFRGGSDGIGLNPRGNAITSVEAVPMPLESPIPMSTQFNLYGVKPFAWGNTYPQYTVDKPTTPHVDPTPFVAPHVYNTAYSWGHPDFVNWWMKNNTPENQGKVLRYPGGDGRGGRWIVINGGGSPVLEGNYDGSIPTGVYQRGSGVGAYEVQNQTPVQYDGAPIKGTEVYFTPAGRAQEPYELGEYQVFKKGGKVNYLSYTH